jgi:hypothetical protein
LKLKDLILGMIYASQAYLEDTTPLKRERVVNHIASIIIFLLINTCKQNTSNRREKTMSTNLDFDYLSKLYKTDPVKFEELRAQEIEKVIQSASTQGQRRLRGLQFQIDAKRKIHKDSPIGASIAISKMMHESFESLRFHLNQAVDNKDPLSHQPIQDELDNFSNRTLAKVIPLRG